MLILSSSKVMKTMINKGRKEEREGRREEGREEGRRKGRRDSFQHTVLFISFLSA